MCELAAVFAANSARPGAAPGVPFGRVGVHACARAVATFAAGRHCKRLAAPLADAADLGRAARRGRHRRCFGLALRFGFAGARAKPLAALGRLERADRLAALLARSGKRAHGVATRGRAERAMPSGSFGWWDVYGFTAVCALLYHWFIPSYCDKSIISYMQSNRNVG